MITNAWNNLHLYPCVLVVCLRRYHEEEARYQVVSGWQVQTRPPLNVASHMLHQAWWNPSRGLSSCIWIAALFLQAHWIHWFHPPSCQLHCFLASSQAPIIKWPSCGHSVMSLCLLLAVLWMEYFSSNHHLEYHRVRVCTDWRIMHPPVTLPQVDV